MAGQTAIAAAVKGDGHVEGVVTDEGRGIQAESLPRLFRKFCRVQAARAGDDDNTSFIFAEPCVGYRIPRE